MGPTKTDSPPRPPDNKGKPNATNMINKRTLIVPVFFPKKQPANITPKVCVVIGTGINPRGIGGIKPNTPINAANNAANTISFVFIMLPPFFYENITTYKESTSM
ncbi:hypothetical protein D3C73_1480130 [compost metagenome]